MSSYQGGSKAASRIQALEAQRKSQQQQHERRKEQIVTASSNVLHKAVSNNFQSRSNPVDDFLNSDTVGLVTHRDFKARRELLQRGAETTQPQPPTAHCAASSAVKPLKRKAKRTKLSFAADSDQSDRDSDSSSSTQSNASPEHSAACNASKKRRLGKDPNVDTHFLPDTDLERARQQERERLRQEWLDKQQLIKNQIVRITYSFWDGTGHRKVINCKKGTTIAHFLTMVQPQIKQLRNTTAESLMFIKEDLIIPHHYSFYDFIVSKARGKSGPLFNFDVVEDVRVVADAGKEKEDAHAAKVVERRWYERNRHIFPASRWELYDPTKKFSKYTIHGT